MVVEAAEREEQGQTPTTVTPPVHEEAPAGSFAAGYVWHHRAYELIGITACVVTASMGVYRIATTVGGNAWVLPLGLILGILAADWVSGFVHWLFDTWGSTDTPVVGQLAIRTFREHHVDQKAICGHDFVETNGHNMALSVLPLTGALMVSDSTTAPGALAVSSLVFWGLFVSMTSQIHKWAHMASPPSAVARLQRWGLLLSPARHDVHHHAPYDDNYCITSGWLNTPLRKLGYYRVMERVITFLTGAIPRKDDVLVTVGGTSSASHSGGAAKQEPRRPG
jgi:plasmanylethanolamine desaturase